MSSDVIGNEKIMYVFALITEKVIKWKVINRPGEVIISNGDEAKQTQQNTYTTRHTIRHLSVVKVAGEHPGEY